MSVSLSFFVLCTHHALVVYHAVFSMEEIRDMDKEGKLRAADFLREFEAHEKGDRIELDLDR